MPGIRPSRYYKVVVCFERRPDGGLRAWSDSVPGFVLSHKDIDLLLADIQPALEFILSERFGANVLAEPLDDLRGELESCGVVDPKAPQLPRQKEYVALYA